MRRADFSVLNRGLGQPSFGAFPKDSTRKVLLPVRLCGVPYFAARPASRARWMFQTASSWKSSASRF